MQCLVIHDSIFTLILFVKNLEWTFNKHAEQQCIFASLKGNEDKIRKYKINSQQHFVSSHVVQKNS